MLMGVKSRSDIQYHDEQGWHAKDGIKSGTRRKSHGITFSKSNDTVPQYLKYGEIFEFFEHILPFFTRMKVKNSGVNQKSNKYHSLKNHSVCCHKK